MHIRIFTEITHMDLENTVNKMLKDFYSYSPSQRNFIEIEDIKITCDGRSYTALIIYNKTDPTRQVGEKYGHF